LGLGIDALEVAGPEPREVAHDLLVLGLPHEARVDVQKIHLFGVQRFQQKRAGHRGVHPSRNQKQDWFGAHLGPDAPRLLLEVGLHRPTAPRRADAEDKTGE